MRIYTHTHIHSHTHTYICIYAGIDLIKEGMKQTMSHRINDRLRLH